MIIISGGYHATHAHKVVYGDCQNPVSNETWIVTSYLENWQKGIRDKGETITVTLDDVMLKLNMLTILSASIVAILLVLLTLNLRQRKSSSSESG